MPDGTTIGYLLTHFSIVVLALILLDRSHRDGHKKMEELYKQHDTDNHAEIDSLKRQLDRLEDRRVEAQHHGY